MKSGRCPCWLPWLASILLIAPGWAADDSIDAVQRAAAEWARLRSETAQLESDWEWQRAAAEASLTALQDRERELVNHRDLLEATIKASEAKTAGLANTTATARQTMAEIENRLARITTDVLAIRPWLPPRLASAVELSYRSLADASLAPAERLQHALTILQRCEQFNRTITYSEEVLAIDGSGEPRMLQVLYWGLSHAYALDRPSGRAYFGHPAADGWSWQPQEGLAPAVARLIDIHQEKDEPAFVQLPVSLSDPFADQGTEP